MIFKLTVVSFLLYGTYGFNNIPPKPSYNVKEYKAKYDTIGNWNLKGTSVNDLNDSNVFMEISPRKNLKNLEINLTKQVNIGPVCYKDKLNGIVFCKRQSKDTINYKFKPNMYSIAIITVCGIEIPTFGLNNKKKLNDNLNIDNIDWHQQNDVLFIKSGRRRVRR